MKGKNIKNNKGFALLFSVLISSLLLTIGLSIFSIALKELAISTATRQSIHAFYAADSGRECVLYWDQKGGMVPSLESTGVYGGEIKCGSDRTNLVQAGSLTGTSRIPTTGSPNFYVVSDDGPDFANFYVNIVKNWTSDNSKIKTTINVYGYDSANDDRVERAIELTY